VRAPGAYRADGQSVGADGEVPCHAGHVHGEGDGGALSRHPSATPSPAMSPAKLLRASTTYGQGQSKSASNRAKDDRGSLPPMYSVTTAN
jgi:hypothetical protein